MRAFFSLTSILTVAAGAALLGSDWPSWRGPSNNGVSPETGLPVTWSASCADAPAAAAAPEPEPPAAAPGQRGRGRRGGREGRPITPFACNKLETENVAARFDRVVIASGDQIFAEHAARLHREGVKVTVVTRRESLSNRLKLATRDQRFLNPEREIAAELAARIP